MKMNGRRAAHHRALEQGTPARLARRRHHFPTLLLSSTTFSPDIVVLDLLERAEPLPSLRRRTPEPTSEYRNNRFCPIIVLRPS
jgi:hypothetical protein